MSTVRSLACYEKDFAQWAFDTAEAIRDRHFDMVDWDSVAEEIESLGNSERRELASRLTQLIYHLLKIEYQPKHRTGSWERTVRGQRQRICRVLKRQPSLRSWLKDPEVLSDAYADVSLLAAQENLPDAVFGRFPDECPYTLEMLLPDLGQE